MADLQVDSSLFTELGFQQDAERLHSLCIGDMQNVNRDVRDVITSLITALIAQSEAIVEIRLWNLGMAQDEGESILEAIHSQNFTSIQCLDLSQNPEWWTVSEDNEQESTCLQILKAIVSQQSNLETLELSGNNTLPFEKLLQTEGLPESFLRQVCELMRIATREQRLEIAANSLVRGQVRFNDQWIQRNYKTWQDMDALLGSEEFVLTDLHIFAVQTTDEALNDLLDYACCKISIADGLQKLDLSNLPLRAQLEPCILESLAIRAAGPNLETLTLKWNGQVSAASKQAIVKMVQLILQANPPLKTLNLDRMGLPKDSGVQIIDALASCEITTLETIVMTENYLWLSLEESV